MSDQQQSPTLLPLHGAPGDDEADDSCGPKAYVTLEEKALLVAMRGLRAEAETARNALETATGDAERRRLEEEIQSLRVRWRELAAQREQAYHRKMVMLGHIEE